MCTDVSCFRPGNACIRKSTSESPKVSQALLANSHKNDCIRKATCLYPKSTCLYPKSNMPVSEKLCLLEFPSNLPTSACIRKATACIRKATACIRKASPKSESLFPHLCSGFLAALNPRPPSVLNKPPPMTTNGVMNMDYVKTRTRVLQTVWYDAFGQSPGTGRGFKSLITSAAFHASLVMGKVSVQSLYSGGDRYAACNSSKLYPLGEPATIQPPQKWLARRLSSPASLRAASVPNFRQANVF